MAIFSAKKTAMTDHTGKWSTTRVVTGGERLV